MAGRIRILYIIDHLRLGGAQEVLHHHISCLNHQRFAIEICALNGRDDYEGRHGGHTTYVLASRRLYLCSIIWRLYRLLRSQKYDVIHTHLYWSKLLTRILVLLFFRRRKCKIVVHEHEPMYTRLLVRFFAPVGILIERGLYTRTDMVLCCAESIHRFCIERLRYSNAKCRFFPNAIHGRVLDGESSQGLQEAMHRARKETTGVVFGIMSRLHPAKGIDNLIRSFGLLERESGERDRHKLLIAGYGRYREVLERLTTRLRLNKNVHFLGIVINGRRSFYQNIDCFIMPSNQEGTPLVLLEALYFKVPIIACETGGVSQVLGRGRYGSLVSSNSAPALQEKLNLFIDQHSRKPDVLTEMTEAGYAHMKNNYTMDRCIGHLEDIYDGLVPEGRT